jgi:hypothetical protein
MLISGKPEISAPRKDAEAKITIAADLTSAVIAFLRASFPAS